MANELTLKNTFSVKLLLYGAAVFSLLFAVFFTYLSPQRILAISIAFLLYLIAYANVRWGVIALLVSLPFAGITAVTGVANATIPELALFATLFAWSLKKSREDRITFGHKGVTTLISAFVFLGFLSILLAGEINLDLELGGITPNPTYETAADNPNLQALMSLRELLHIIEWLVAYVIAFDVTQKFREIIVNSSGVLAGIIAAATLSLPEYLGKTGAGWREKLLVNPQFSMFFNSASSAMIYTLFSIVICMALLTVSKKRVYRSLCWAGFIVLSLSMFFTYSTFGWVSYATTVLAYLVVSHRLDLRSVTKKRLVGAALLVLVTAFPLAYAFEFVDKEIGLHEVAFIKSFLRAPEEFEYGGDYRSTRMQHWVVGLDVVKNTPEGVGLGRYPVKSPKYLLDRFNVGREYAGVASVYDNAHNYFLQVWAELGLAGLFLFLWILHALARDVIDSIKATSDKHTRALYYAIALGLCAVVLQSSFDHPLLVPSIAILFWFQAGMISKKIQVT